MWIFKKKYSEKWFWDWPRTENNIELEFQDHFWCLQCDADKKNPKHTNQQVEILFMLFQVHLHQTRYLLQDERDSDPYEERRRGCVGSDHPLFVVTTDARETGIHPGILLVERTLQFPGCFFVKIELYENVSACNS